MVLESSVKPNPGGGRIDRSYRVREGPRMEGEIYRDYTPRNKGPIGPMEVKGPRWKGHNFVL